MYVDDRNKCNNYSLYCLRKAYICAVTFVLIGSAIDVIIIHFIAIPFIAVILTIIDSVAF